jgi:hypothetical protein
VQKKMLRVTGLRSEQLKALLETMILLQNGFLCRYCDETES